MSTVTVEVVGQERLNRAQRMLAGIPDGIDKAVKSAMNRTVANVRVKSIRAVQEKYAISAGNIRANQNIKVKYKYDRGVQAEIYFRGNKIPLWRYTGSSPKGPTQTEELVRARVHGEWKTVHPGVTARGRQFKSRAPVRLSNTFVATMKSGHTGIFRRTGGATSTGGDELKEIMGSSVPQMIGNEEVLQKISKEAAEKFEERLEHEVLRLLNGWGG